MMKWWLIILIYNQHGEFSDKKEFSFANRPACLQALKAVKQTSPIPTRTFCVTDDHFQGRKTDPGIPLDFDGE